MVTTRILEPTPTVPGAPSHSPPDTRYAPSAGLARKLAAFGIGLGLVEIFAHRQLARLIGVRDYPVLLPLFGFREIAAGVMTLTETRPTYGMWARVAGDALDLAFLGANFLSPQTRKDRLLAAAAAVGGVTALDALSCTQLTAAEALEP